MTEKSNQSLTKRGFNLPHVFDSTLISLLVAYAFVLFSNLSEILASVEIGNTEFCLWGVEGWIALIGGSIISLWQFRFLNVKNRCITIFSFGESRKKLFHKKIWFPLGCMAAITLVYYLVILVLNIIYQAFEPDLIDEFIAIVLCSLMLLVLGYTVGAFARVFAGKTSEAVVLGTSALLLPYAVFGFVDAVLSTLLRGYSMVASEGYLSNYEANNGMPLPSVLSILDPVYFLNKDTPIWYSEELSDSFWVYTPAYCIIKSIAFIGICVAATILLENYFSKNYKAENCDKTGKHKAITVLCSLTLPLLFCTLINSVLDGTEVTIPAYFSFSTIMVFVVMFACVLISLILALIINSILYRNVKKLKFATISVGIIALLNIVMVVISLTGGFGYKTRVPETEEIKSVMINDVVGLLPKYSTEYFDEADPNKNVEITFKTEEEIELVKDIHNLIINEKDYDTTETFTIIYELENGKVIYRTYPHLSNEACEKISTLWETDTVRNFYKTIFNQNPQLKAKEHPYNWREWEAEFAFNSNDMIDEKYRVNSDYYVADGTGYYNEYASFQTVASADSLVIFSKDDISACITNEQVSKEIMKKLRKALYEDYLNMSAQQFYKPKKQIGVISLASSKNLIAYDKEGAWTDEGPDLSAESVLDRHGGNLFKFSVTSDMVNTIKVLEDADLYKHFFAKKEIEKAHLIDAQKLIDWMDPNAYFISKSISRKDENKVLLSNLDYYWNSYTTDDYFMFGCNYVTGLNYEVFDYNNEIYNDDHHVNKPISESDIEKITPEEAEKLREKAFMTYNAGNDCKFLVMKYTDGTANMLVIPN